MVAAYSHEGLTVKGQHPLEGRMDRWMDRPEQEGAEAMDMSACGGALSGELRQDKGLFSWEDLAGVSFLALDATGRCVRLQGLGTPGSNEDPETRFCRIVDGAEVFRREVLRMLQERRGGEILFRLEGQRWHGTVIPVALASGERGALVLGGAEREAQERLASRPGLLEHVPGAGKLTDALLTALPDAFLVIGADDRVEELRAGAEFPLLAPPGDVRRRRLADLPNFPQDLVQGVQSALDTVRKSGQLVRFEYELEFLEQIHHFEARFFAVGQEQVGVMLRDLTPLRSVKNNLALAEKIIESALEGIVVTDVSGGIETVNAAFTRITGYTREEVLGRNPRILKSHHHDAAFYRRMWQALRTVGKWEGEIWNRRKNGEVYPEWLAIHALRNAEGETTHYVSVFSDLSQIKAQEAQIEHQAYHDRLTGLPNRSLFLNLLSVEIDHARQNLGTVGMLFLNLDRFKAVNDSLGHVAGDRVLMEMGQRLQRLAGEGKTVSHTGGDEFCLLVPSPGGPKELAHVAAEVLELLKNPVDAGGFSVYLTASIGIALFPDDGQNPLSLAGAADRAMNRAKAGGGDAYSFHTEEMNRAARKRFALETGLRRAVAREDFCLHYQPQVRPKARTVFGVEALVRWRGEDGKLIPPGDFIPLAEETGLIVPLGAWVLRTACAQARQWLDAGLGPLEVSVNISAVQLYRSSLWDTVAEQIEEFFLPPNTLALEMTENTILQDWERAASTFRELKKLGVSLYIDDFGTGYSSLSYLRDFAIDGLKVDKSFVDHIPDAGKNEALVRGILAIARGLGLRTVVEGVETEAQEDVLRAMENDLLIQGYRYSPPIPPEDVELLLRRQAFGGMPAFGSGDVGRS